ncbi:hypothetical protein B0H11DRAFT_2182988 [Mycena galericulata]|nr:hypothetical protein B0H11DRAFT_2182988 [Mycena galericulata]
MAWVPRCSGFLFGRDSRFRQCRMNGTVVSEPPFEEVPFGGRPFLSIEAFSRVTLQIFVRGTANTVMERAYVEDDLKNLTRPQLVALIQRQISKWPLPQGKLKKENMANLKAKLLDPSLGFTTINPLTPGLISSPVPAVSQGTLSDVIGQLGASHTGSSVSKETSVINEEVKDIHLFLDDSRPTLEVVKTFQRIKVPMVDSQECEEGGWRVNAMDVISALQNSPGRVYGSGRIGVPARFDGSYTEYFVQMNSDEPIRALAFDPELLIVPKNNRLNLRISGIPRTNSQPTDLEQVPSVATATGPISGSVARIKEPTTREIEWLKDRIKILPGYTNFEANHHKNLQNSDRVEYWRFAFNVDQQFYKTSWPAEISTRKITKPAIQQALQVGTTALAESIQMIGIIDRYTTQGDNYSAQVATEICKSDQEEPKAMVLKAFLLQWEKDHRVAK